MKIGSRPVARIPRTGELTPPGITSRARLYSSAERVSVSEAVMSVSFKPKTLAHAQLPGGGAVREDRPRERAGDGFSATVLPAGGRAGDRMCIVDLFGVGLQH